MHLESIFRALTFVWLIAEILIAVLTFTRKGEGKILDRGTQIMLWIVLVASLRIDEWMHNLLPPDMPGSYTWLRPVAVAVFVLGLVIRATAVFNLGRAFSANVAVRSGQKLKRTGLYRIVRHPSYFGLELILLALGLHARTWACLAEIMIPCTLALLYRIHVEEIALHQAFGDEYEDYSRTTKRLIPFVY